MKWHVGTHVKLARTLALALVVTALASCAPKSPGGSSKIVIPVPAASSPAQKSMVQALATYPTSGAGTLCYGVNVRGAGIAETPSACGPSKGVWAGFVPNGGVLEVSVPRGTGRVVDLFLFVAPAGSTCPAFDFDCVSAKTCSLFKVGSAGVDTSSEQASVSITASFPGWDQSAAHNSNSPLICEGSLKAALESTGQVLDPTGATFSSDISAMINEWLFMDGSLPTAIASSSCLLEKPAVVIPPYVRSITQKPDTRRLYGLIGNGTVVEVDTSSGELTTFDESSCPFAACEVPPFFQSISAGLGNSLFGLDHSGRVYKINSFTSLTATTTQVPANVVQVSFF